MPLIQSQVKKNREAVTVKLDKIVLEQLRLYAEFIDSTQEHVVNEALGLTSIVVTYDVAESLKIVDYVYFISDGVVVAEGTTEQVMASNDAFVRQFVHALPDGPVAFHYPSRPYAEDLGLSKAPA